MGKLSILKLTYLSNQTRKLYSVYNAFASLATKFLSINPTGTIPTTSFGVVPLALTATEGERAITFTARGKNGINSTTGFLLQKLTNINRKHTSAYPSKIKAGTSELSALLPLQ